MQFFELRLQRVVEKTILRVVSEVMEDYTRRIVMMTLKQIAGLGGELTAFLGSFADCFGRREARKLLRIYVKGQLSDEHRKTAEAIALRFGAAPRTLQRFLESIKWDEKQLRDRCGQIIATDHAHAEAIGMVDESGTTKSGNRGKIDNCTVGVHLAYATPGFQTLLDSELYLPEDWINDPARRKKRMSRRRSNFEPSRKSRWV
ncbi:MAG: transposase [Planctomycetes bacterium]|nr:transposase [Planctomycetota bacterium]